MIAEAIERVTELAHDANAVEQLNVPGQPPHLPYVRVGNEVRKLELDPPDRAVQLDCLVDLIDLAKQHFDKDIAEAKRQAVFFNDDNAQLVFDTDTGRERAVVVFESSREWKWILERIKEPKVGQRDLRDALRVIFPDAYSEDSQIVAQVSSIGWQVNEGAHQNLDRDNESMGASIAKKVESSVGMPPERFTLNIRRWTNPDTPEREPITVLIDPDHACRCFRVVPIETSLIEFRQTTLGHVAGQLRKALDKVCPVYQGRFRQRGVSTTPPTDIPF